MSLGEPTVRGARLRLGVGLAIVAAVAACSVDSLPTTSSNGPPLPAQVFQVSVRSGSEMIPFQAYEVRGEVPRTPTLDWKPEVVQLSVGSRAPGSGRHRFPLSSAMDSLSRAMGPAAIVQPRLSGQRFESVTSDGTPVAAVYSRRMKGRSGVGEATLALYERNRLTMIQEIAFRETRRGSEMFASRLTLFDSTGRVAATVDGSDDRGNVARARGSRAPADALNRMAQVFVPKDANASAIDDGPCQGEFLLFWGAVVAAGWETLAFAIKAYACVHGVVSECLLAAVEFGKLTGVSLALIGAMMVLNDCRKRNGEPTFFDSVPPPDTGCGGGSGGGGGGYESLRQESMSSCEGGGGGGGIRCYTIDWYTTWDGGITWHCVDQTMHCFPLNEF
jgi:hypothetical protein